MTSSSSDGKVSSSTSSYNNGQWRPESNNNNGQWNPDAGNNGQWNPDSGNNGQWKPDVSSNTSSNTTSSEPTSSDTSSDTTSDVTSSEPTSSETPKDENSGIPDVELAKGDWSNFAYDRDMLTDTVLIPNGLNEWNEERYEMTGHINDINQANTQVLMEYHDKGYAGNIYEYGVKRESVSHWQNTNYYAYDGRGSVSDLVDGSGEVQMYHSYEPDGQTTLRFRGYIKNPYRYNAERVDYVPGIADFQYLRARYYRPDMARFITQDVVWGNINVPLTQNLYAYVGNNPINRIDPSGHRAMAIDGSGGSWQPNNHDKQNSYMSSGSQSTNGQAKNKVQSQMEIADENSYYENCGDGLGSFMDVSGDVMLGILASVFKNMYSTVAWYPEMIKSIQNAFNQNGFGNYNGMLDGIVSLSGSDQIEGFFRSKATDESAFYGGMIVGDIVSIIGGVYGAYIGITAALGGTGSQLAHTVPGPGTVVAAAGAAVAVAGAVVAVAGVSLAVSGAGNLSSSIEKFDKANGDAPQQLKKVGSNSKANEIAEEFGFDSAEDFKESIVGKGNISKFNIKYNPKTNEIILESIKNATQVPTGYFMP